MAVSVQWFKHSFKAMKEALVVLGNIKQHELISPDENYLAIIL